MDSPNFDGKKRTHSIRCQNGLTQISSKVVQAEPFSIDSRWKWTQATSVETFTNSSCDNSTQMCFTKWAELARFSIKLDSRTFKTELCSHNRARLVHYRWKRTHPTSIQNLTSRTELAWFVMKRLERITYKGFYDQSITRPIPNLIDLRVFETDVQTDWFARFPKKVHSPQIVYKGFSLRTSN